MHIQPKNCPLTPKITIFHTIPSRTKLVNIKQDNEYTKQLTGKADADYEIYLKLRSEYINTPKFYFNMADWFFKPNDREKAIRILTSIADIDLENALLFRLLSYRLKEYKEYALDIRVVINWNMNNTDIDLHVKDPNGENAFTVIMQRQWVVASVETSRVASASRTVHAKESRKREI